MCDYQSLGHCLHICGIVPGHRLLHGLLPVLLPQEAQEGAEVGPEGARGGDDGQKGCGKT